MTTGRHTSKDVLLDAAEAVVVEVRQAEATRLRIARDWARAHPPAPDQLARNPLCARTIGTVNLAVTQHVEGELAACLQIHPLAALRLMADAVDLEVRMPHTWAAVVGLEVETWAARKMIALTSRLTDELARRVDAQVADLLATLAPGRLLKVVEARVVEADQDLAERIAAERATRHGVWLSQDTQDGDGGATRGMVARGEAAGMGQLDAMITHPAHLLRAHCPDLTEETRDQLRARALTMLANPLAALKLLVGADQHDEHQVPGIPEVVADAIRDASPAATRPRATLYLHLTPETLRGRGVARAEDLGALTRRQLIDLLGHHHVTLKPVIDLNTGAAADCYEVPARISEQLGLTKPADCFPYATSTSRRQDQDHTTPYRPDGPPGQTATHNLGRMTRRHHRIKTFAGWHVWQHDHTYLWLSPRGRTYITDTHGTHTTSIDVGDFGDVVDVVLGGDLVRAS